MTLVELSDASRAPLAAILERMLNEPNFTRPLFSFHHHFGLLAGSRERSQYYIHSPTRFLYESARVPWEVEQLSGGLLESVRSRELENISRAHRIFTNSEGTRDRIRRAYGVDALVAYPPTELWRSARTRPRGLPAGVDRFVLTVSRHSPSKRLAECLAAVLSTGVTWVIAGGGVPDPALAEEPNCVLLGPVNDSEVAWLIVAASACLSAPQEDFGIFIAESLTLGTAVAINVGSGAAEIAPDGVALYEDPAADSGASLAMALQVAMSTRPRPTEVERLRDRLSIQFFRDTLFG